MKIISFFFCTLFIGASGDTKASFSKDSGVYFLEVIDIPKGPPVVRVSNRDEQKNLEKTNFDDFGNLTRIPVVLTAKETYKFGEYTLEKDDKITVSYHFDNYKIINTLDKKSPMHLPKEFEAMTEWQAVIHLANALLGEKKFSTIDPADSVIAFMNNSERDHRKPKYQENWIKELFWRKTS